MKKIIVILVVMLTFSTQAQQRKHKRNKVRFTTEQHVEMAVKRMTLTLDLSEKQQQEIKPLFLARAKKRKEAMEARKTAKKEQKRPTADKIYKMQMDRLNDMIAMKNSMKEILNKDQFEKYQKLKKKRKNLVMKKKKQQKMMPKKKRKRNFNRQEK